MAFVFSSIGTESRVNSDSIELVCVATRKDKSADMVRAGDVGSRAYELPPYHSIARVYVEGKPGAEVTLSCAAGGVMLSTPRPFAVVLDASGKRAIYLAGSACSFARTVRATPKLDVGFGDVRVRLTLVPEPPVRVVSQATAVAELVAAVFVENVAWPVYELSPSVVPQGHPTIVVAPQTAFVADTTTTLTVAGGGTFTAQSVDAFTGVLTFTGVTGLGSIGTVGATLKVFKTNAELRTADTTVALSIVVAPVPTAINGVLSTLGSGAYNIAGSGPNTYFVRSDIVADLTFTLDRAVYGTSPWPWKDTLRDIVVVENNGLADTRRSVRATATLDTSVATSNSGTKVVFGGYKPTAGCTSVKFEFVTAASTFVSPSAGTFAVLTPPTIASAVLTVESAVSGTYVAASTYLVRGDKVRLTCELSSAALDGQTVAVTIGASTPTCVIGTGGASGTAKTFYVDYTVVGAGAVACSASVTFSGVVALAMPASSMATASLDLLRNAGNIYGAPTTNTDLGTVTAWIPPGGGSPWARVGDVLATSFGFAGMQDNATGGKSLNEASSVPIRLFMLHKTSSGGAYTVETELPTTVATNTVTASATVHTRAHGVEFVLKVLSSSGRVIMTTAPMSTIATVYALPSIAFTDTSVSSLYGTGIAFVRGPHTAGAVMTSNLAFNLAVGPGQLSFPASLASTSYADYIHSVTSSGSNDLSIDIATSNPVFAANGLGLTIAVAPAAMANIGNPTVTIVWKTAGGSAGSSTVMSIDSGCIQRVPTSLATSVWWSTALAVSAADTGIAVTVAPTGGDGFKSYTAGTTTLVPTVNNAHMDAASAGTWASLTTWAVTGVRPSSTADGASDATSTLTYSHTNGGTNWSYAYTSVAIIPKAYIYLQPAAANVTWSKTSLDAAVETELTMSIAKPGGGTNTDNVPLPTALTLFVGGGNLTAGESYAAGSGGNPATVLLKYTSTDDNVATTFKVTVATPRGTTTQLTAPNVSSVTTATALAFKTLFTVDGTAYLVTAASGTSSVALTRSGAALAARFAASGLLSAALSANTYDPGVSNTDIPLSTRVFAATNGEFEVPAQAFATKKISVTMRDTGTVVKSAQLTSGQIYDFPTEGSVEFQNMASAVVTHLVLGTQYKAVRTVTGRKFPPVADTSVVPTISNTSARAGVAIAQDATTVTCTFTPASQTLAPVCSGLAVTLANGALHTYSGWTAQMYTLPSFSVAAGNAGVVSIPSITANVPTDVTVTFADTGGLGNPLGNPVSLSNVFLVIDGTPFVATSFPTATSVTASVTTTLAATSNAPISVVVKYPSVTGLSSTAVPGVGTVTGATINVLTSPFPAYALAPSTVVSGTTTLRLAPEIAFLVTSATLNIGASAVNHASIDDPSGVITFTVPPVTANKNAVLYVTKTGGGNKTYDPQALTVTASAAPATQTDLTEHGSSLAAVSGSVYNTSGTGTTAYFARTGLPATWTFTFGTAPYVGSWKNTFTDIVVVETATAGAGGAVVRNSLRVAATAALPRFSTVTVSGFTVVITGYQAPDGTATVSVEFIVGATTIRSPASGSYSVLTPPTVTAVALTVQDGTAGGTTYATAPAFLVRGDVVKIEFTLSSDVFNTLAAGNASAGITPSGGGLQKRGALAAIGSRKFTVDFTIGSAVDHTITASVDFSGITVLALGGFATELALLLSGATRIYGTPTQTEFDAATQTAPWTVPSWARVGDTLDVSYTYAGLFSTARTVGGKAPDGNVVKIWYKTNTAYSAGSWLPATFASPAATSVTAASGAVVSAAVAIPPGAFQIQFYVSVVNLCATPKVTVTSAALSTIPTVYAHLGTITVGDSNNYGTGVVFVRGPDSSTAFESKLNLSLGAASTQLWLPETGVSATNVSAHFTSVECSAMLGYTELTPTVVSAVSVPGSGALAGLSFELTKCKGDTAAGAATNQTVTIVWKKADASAGRTTVVTILAASIVRIPASLKTNIRSAALDSIASHDNSVAGVRLVALTNNFLPSAAGTISASAASFLGGLSTVTVGTRRSGTEWDLDAVAISSAAVATADATATVTYSHTYLGASQWTYDYATTVIVEMDRIYVVPIVADVTLTLPILGQTELEANVATAGIALEVASRSRGVVTITGVTDDVSGTVSAPSYTAASPGTGTFTYKPPNADGDVKFTVTLATPRGASVARQLAAKKYERMPSALDLTTLFALTGASAVNYVATSVTGTLKATLTGATGSAGTPFWNGSTVSNALSLKYDSGPDLTGLNSFTGAGAGAFTIGTQVTAGSKSFVATMARTKKALTYAVVGSTVYDFPVLDPLAAATVFKIGAGGAGGAVVTHLVAGTQYCCERTFKDGSARGKFPPATASLGAGVTFSAGGGFATAIATGDTKVTVTFTPNAQVSPPVCTLAVALDANGASTDYGTAWTAQMYTVPNHAANAGVIPSSITASVPEDVTVTFSNALGSPVSLNNVFLVIGGVEFVATNINSTQVTARVTAAAAGSNIGISVRVKYPSETGLSVEVPTVGTVSGWTINVAEGSYELQASTMTRSSNNWTAVTGGWLARSLGVTAGAFTEYQPDGAGEFGLTATTPTTGMMFRGIAGAPSFSTSSSVAAPGVKYLLIVENDAVLSTASSATDVKSAVQWVATLNDSSASCTVTTSKGSFGDTGKYTTSFAFSGTPANVIDKVYVNGEEVTLGQATSIGPFALANGMRAQAPFVAPNGVPGGLCYGTYAMHIVFKPAAGLNLKITGFNTGATDGGTHARSTAYASFPRFGAFNAYGQSQYTASNFVSNTAGFVATFGVPTVEVDATLGARLALAYGMKFDAHEAVEFCKGKGLTVADGTGVTFRSHTYPPAAGALNAKSASTLTYASPSQGIDPIETLATPWPWSGYETTGLSDNQALPMGFFSDVGAASGGLPIVANNGAAKPAVTIRKSNTSKWYLSIDPTASGKVWVMGGIQGGKTGFAANSASFGGTVIDGAAVPTARMTSALGAIKYTAVSWVGCAFHNQTCLSGPSTLGQTFPWAGFYLSSGVAQVSPAAAVMRSGGVDTNKVIVWDVAQANGASWASGGGGLINNNALNSITTNNVMMWTPLAGTDPADRATMHVFTLRINNQVTGLISDANASDWAQLYQNGVKLVRVNVIDGSTILPKGSSGVANILFSSGSVAKASAAVIGGAPVANAFASVGDTTKWAFAENQVQTRSSATYTDAEVAGFAAGLCTKWGIFPSIAKAADSVVVKVVFDRDVDVTIKRIGFFFTAEAALAGTAGSDLADGKLGFAQTGATWTGGATTRRTGGAPGATWKAGADHTVNEDDNGMSAASLPAVGPFVRMNLSIGVETYGTIRMWMRLALAGVAKWYTLAFSYNGQPCLSGSVACVNAGGTLAYRGVFRLIELTGDPAGGAGTVAGNWAAANVYSPVSDSTKVESAIADVKDMTQDPNSATNATFSASALAAIYASPLTSLKTFGSFTGGKTGGTTTVVTKAIPAWTTTANMVECWEVGKTSGIATANSPQPYWMAWGDVAVRGSAVLTVEYPTTLVRALMEFPSKKVVDRLLIYAGSPGLHTPWPKFEIVASKDGTTGTYVRLRTKWRVSAANVYEDTFSLDHKRKRWDDAPFSYTPALAKDTALVVGGGIAFGTTNNFVRAGNNSAAIANAPTFLWTIDIDNQDEYTHYGIGCVGSDISVSAVGGTDDTSRQLARHPFGDYRYAAANADLRADPSAATVAAGVLPWSPTTPTANAGKINNTNLANINAVQSLRVFLPQVSIATAVPAPVAYKGWRLRATTAFIGVCGSSTAAWFCKMGLYRDAATATADNLGLSSNNYVQQYANAADNNGATVTEGNAAHNLLFTSTGLWGATQSTAGDATKVTFATEAAYFALTLDVTGPIGVVRFPENVYSDALVTGGTFILEASVDGTTTWLPMVAVSSDSKYLGREGTMAPSASGGNGNRAIASTQRTFAVTLASAAAAYAIPTSVTIVGNPTLEHGSVTRCSVTIGGGSYVTTSNVAADFNVHCALSSASPKWAAPTKFNCTVVSYTSGTGVLEFDAKPEAEGASVFTVLVRSGNGSGVLAATVDSGTSVTVGAALARTIDATSFGLASANDDVAYTSGFAAAKFSLGTPSNLTTVKSYYRDLTGEWAPSGTTSKTLGRNNKPMLRCDFNSGQATVDIKAATSGYAVIVVQCHTIKQNSASVIWHATPSGGSRTLMTPVVGGVSTYVAPPATPQSVTTFVEGVNRVAESLETSTRQTQVQFAAASIAGAESNRWYNGMKGSSLATTNIDAVNTQQPCLGAAGDTMLQDFVTIHQFGAEASIELTSINNAALGSIGATLSSDTPYACQVATNKCGGARFAEFTVIPIATQEDELVSLGADIANKWCVPYAGPTIKKFRVVNAGSAAITIGWVGIYKSAFDVDVGGNTNLISVSTMYTASGIVLSAGGSPSATWSTADPSTNPFESIGASGGYIEFTLATAVANGGFVRFGNMITGAQARIRIEVACHASAAWEPYHLWYHHGGVAKDATNADCAALNVVAAAGTSAYAKGGVFMPWKAKYGSTLAAAEPYYVPRYQAALEGSAAHLAVLSATLMSPAWDGDSAIKHYVTYKTTAGTFAANQLLDFTQWTGTYNTQSAIDALAERTGAHDLGARLKVTKLDYLPAATLVRYGAVFRQKWDAAAKESDSLALACVDPNTLTSPFAASLLDSSRLPVNTRLRKSLVTSASAEGRWYVEVPKCFVNGGSIQETTGGATIAGSTTMRGFPMAVTHRSTRSLFWYAGPDPTIGRVIDTLDAQKKYTVCTMIGNSAALFGMTTTSANGGCSKGGLAQILCGAGLANIPFANAIGSSAVTNVTLRGLGHQEFTSAFAQTGVTTAPQYAALRTCSIYGSSATHHAHTPNGVGERLYMVTVVVDTQANTSPGSFNTDAQFENTAKVYINGKRINTAARRTANGAYASPVTTSVAPGSAYPTNFYNSSALTYGVTQTNNNTANVLTGVVKYPMLAATNAGVAGTSRSLQSQADTNGQSASATGMRATSTFGSAQYILMEVKNECRATSAYTDAEVAAHIEGLSNKWGLPMAYRWLTLTNPTASTPFRFHQFGLYASHTEAYLDTTGSQSAVEGLTNGYTNLLRGFTSTTIASTGGSKTYPVCVNAASKTSVATTLADVMVLGTGVPTSGQGIEIQGGGSITIDLADSVTCSHLRFGSFLAGTYANVRMGVKVTATRPDSDLPGTTYECELRAAKASSGVAEGQFPLNSSAITTATTPFVQVGGQHLNSCGIYVLVPTGATTVVPSVYVAPDRVTDIAVGALTAFVGVVCTIKLSNVAGTYVPASHIAANLTVHLFDSTAVAAVTGGGSYTKPGSPNCVVTSYGVVDGTVTFTATPTSSGAGFRFVVFVDDPSSASVATLADAGDQNVALPLNFVLDWTNITVDVSGMWNNTVPANGINGWTFSAITANSIKAYKPDLAGEFALVAQGALVAQNMYRCTGVAPTQASTGPAQGIMYLLIVESEAFNFGTGTFGGNAVKWTAVGTGGGAGITCAVQGANSSKGRFGIGANEGKYTTTFGISGGLVANLIDKVFVNGVEVDFTGTVGSPVWTRVGPLTKSKGLRGATSGAVLATAPGGLCYTDYAMHIKFKVPVTVSITGFATGGAELTASSVLSRGTAGADAFASFPRFGAFNAYVSGSSVGGHTVDSMAKFFLGTAGIITSLDIPMVEKPETLGPRLAMAYGMPLDAAAALAFYATRGMNVADGTVVTPSSTRTAPTTFLTPVMRTQSIANTSIPPLSHIGTGWPWAGYKSINGQAGPSGYGTELPSGWFGDPTGTGLPIVGNSFGVPLGSDTQQATIRESASKRKYVYFDVRAEAMYICGVRSDTNALQSTPFASSTSPQFGGTLVDAGASQALMTSALSAIRYTAVSWVGSPFGKDGGFATAGADDTHGQGFMWRGFYLGGDTVSGFAGLMKDYTSTLNKIVWNIAEANGETPTATAWTVATYITNAAAPHNVLMWTPLAGTDQADRETMHVFTLVIDNQAAPDNTRTLSDALTNSTIRDWVSLYQNGVKLVMSNVDSTNIYTQYSGTGSAKMISNVLLTSFKNSSHASPLPFKMAGGAPAATAFSCCGGFWAIAENNVQVKSAAGAVAYTAPECTTLTTALALKWGIVPRLSVGASNDDIVALTYGTAGGGWNGTVRLVRMGFFVSAAAASADLGDASTKDLAWNASITSGTGGIMGKSALGFLDAATWTSNEDSAMADETRGTISKLTGSPRAALSPAWSVTLRDVNAGGFVRLNLKYDNTGGGGLAQAANVRLGVELYHDGAKHYYALGFSYNGAAKNTADDPFFDTSGNMLATNGVFRLLRSSAAASVSDLLSSVKAKWNNPYTATMDSTAVQVGAVAAMTRSSASVFSAAALSELYPAASQVDWVRVFGGSAGAPSQPGGHNVGTSIPAWHESTNMVDCWEVGKSSGTPLVKTAQPYWFRWGEVTSVGTVITVNPYFDYTCMFRALMKFDAPRVVKRLLVYATAPPLITPWPKHEIVASKNGTHFVRLPTKWYVGGKNVLEDTFHLDHRRRRWNDTWFSFAPALNKDTAAVVLGALAFPATNYFVSGTAQANCSTFLWAIDLENSDEYTHYGIGTVGTDAYFNHIDGRSDLTRQLARLPIGHAVYNGVHDITRNTLGFQSEGWAPMVSSASAGAKKLNSTNIANIATPYSVKVLLPQVSSAAAVPKTFYKYWRLRATSAFLGACGSSTKAYFWKLGLYRTSDDATADTYGLSSNNYIQQFANVLGISTNGSTPVTQAGTKRDAMFVSKADWTQQWGSATQYASVAGTAALQTNAVDVAFGHELACIHFTLDVAGEIGAIRFPTNMYYDLNVRGGTFILEAATAAAPTTWIAMVATESGGTTKLGREGILNAPPVATGSVGNVALSKTLYTIAPAGAYTPPTTLSLSLGTITALSGSAISITLSGSGFGLTENVAADFTAHVSKAAMPALGTFKTNCAISTYSSGVLAMTVTATEPDATQTLTLLVRSGAGSGVATSVTLSVSVTQPPWQNYILYQSKVSDPGWEKQLAAFARPSANEFSSAYTAFVRATFDTSLYQDGGGTPWSNTTGLCSNMWLKPQYYGQQTDPWLIKNCANQSCWVAPVSGLTGGLTPFVSQQWWDNAGYTSAFVRWGYTSSVTARSVGMCTVSMSTWGPATIVLRGFTSNAFSGGTTLVTFSASSVPVSGDGTGYGWFALSTTGSYSHYELSYSGAKHDHYTWAPILAAFT